MTRHLKDEINACLVAFAPDGEHAAQTAWVFPPEFTGFRGHFPGGPVCPGVCILAAQLEAAARLVGTELDLLEIVNTKFMWPVFPARRVDGWVKAAPADDGCWRVQAELKCGKRHIAKCLFLVRERICKKRKEDGAQKTQEGGMA